MAILKYIERTQVLFKSIKNESTGTPAEFANKLGYSESMLREDLEDLRVLGAEIAYNRSRQSYVLKNNFDLNIEISMNNLKLIKGGTLKKNSHQ